MLTAPVNTYALSNLSLICRNGTEAVVRLTKSPYISTTSVVKTQQPLHRELEQPMPVAPSRRPTKKRSRGVRFSSETLDHVEQTDQLSRSMHRAKKRKRFEPADEASWYSKGELRSIQNSCVNTIKIHHGIAIATTNNDTTTSRDASIECCGDIDTLDRYYPANQKRRRMARKQMYETIKAVSAFEKATGTKAPPELLATLLQRYSMSRVIEANVKALRTAEVCTLSSPN